MDFIMDLQLFGGGGESTSTSREIPDQTANEQALEQFLLDSSSLGGNMAPYAYQAFAGSLNNAFLPNYNDLYSDYVNRLDTHASDYGKLLTDAFADYRHIVDNYGGNMEQSLGEFKDDTNKLVRNYNKSMDGYLGNYVDKEANALGELSAKEDSALRNYLGREQDALSQYEQGANNHLSQYEQSMGNAKAAYDTAMGKRASAWDDLVNGVLPSQYATNRQAALNADLKGTVGSAINNLASRGVINSGVGNKALDDISQSASDTLAKRYADDLSLEASLLGQDRSNIRSDYDVATGNAGSVYGAQSSSDDSLYGNRTGTARSMYGSETDSARSLYGNQAAEARSVYGNQENNATQQFDKGFQANQAKYSNSSDAYTNAMDAYSRLQDSFANQLKNAWDASKDVDDSRYQGAVTGQTASMEVPTQMLSYAGQLQNPVSNLYNTMYSGRMGTGSTTTTTDDGGAGIWSAVGGLGSAAIMMCFTGDTLVTTPDGYKEIANVQEGDTVLSVHDGKIVPKRVVKTYGPNIKEVIEVRFDNGTVWHCTKGQRYFDGHHFGYVDCGITPAMVYQGNKSHLVSVKGKGDVANVYDLKLEGFAGENVFFANDVAAEGLGD